MHEKVHSSPNLQVKDQFFPFISLQSNSFWTWLARDKSRQRLYVITAAVTVKSYTSKVIRCIVYVLVSMFYTSVLVTSFLTTSKDLPFMIHDITPKQCGKGLHLLNFVLLQSASFIWGLYIWMQSCHPADKTNPFGAFDAPLEKSKKKKEENLRSQLWKERFRW